MKLRLLTANNSLFNISLMFLLTLFPLLVFGQVNAPVANYSTYCKGESMPISATSSTQNAQIEWYMDANVNNTQPFTISQNGEVFPLDSLITFGLGTNRIYAVASLGGSKSSSVEVPITIDKAPLVIAIESDGCMLYKGDNVVFSPILENPNGNYTYEWRKIKTKLMAEIPNPRVLSTDLNFSKSSLTEEDAGIYELTVWNENKTCAARFEAPHLIIRGVCMSGYPIEEFPLNFLENNSYAVPTRSLNGSHYVTATDGRFYFRFHSPYRSGMLNIHLYDWTRCEVGTFDLERGIGDNWYSIDLNPVCALNELYVLEVFDDAPTPVRYVLDLQFRIGDFWISTRDFPSTHCPFLPLELKAYIKGGTRNHKVIWYVTTTDSESQEPLQNANWQRVDWQEYTRRSPAAILNYTTTENKTYWFKVKAIDGRGCSTESRAISIKPEESKEPVIYLSKKTSLEQAEYISSENTPLLKGLQLKARVYSNYDEPSLVTVSILKNDGINGSPKTIVKSIEMTTREFVQKTSILNDYTLLFDNLINVPDNFFISIRGNTNLLDWKGGCNITDATNTAWEKTAEGKWQPYSTPISEGGLETPTSLAIRPVFHTKPKTNFVADLALAFPNEEVEFRDISEADPENYEWNLEGASVAQSTNPTFTTKYSKKGEYDVSLITSNISGTDTLKKQDYIRVIEEHSKLVNTEGNRQVLEDDDGFVAGYNSKKDKAKAEYFSTLEDKILQGVEFRLVYLDIQGNVEGKFLRVYAMSSNPDNKSPDVILDSVYVPLSKVKSSMTKHKFLRVSFDKAIEVPNDFYISIGLDYYSYTEFAKFEFTIPTSTATTEKGNTAWEQLADNTWQPYSKPKSEGGRGLSLAHAIYPIMTSNKVLSSEEENSYAENIKLFPNPASDFIKIETKEIQLENYSIVDVIGKTIENGNLSADKTIQINTLTKGLYFIRFKTDKGMITKRFVVK